MFQYLLRRLILLPFTLFCIVLITFIIINLAPGDPVTITEISAEGASRREDRAIAFGSSDLYLQFREFYGLTLPILFNTWSWTTPASIYADLWRLTNKRESPSTQEELAFKKYESLRIHLGDKARFVMPILLRLAEDQKENWALRRMAAGFFVRGGTRQAYLGPALSEEQKKYNRKINDENNLLSRLTPLPTDTPEQVEKKIGALEAWYHQNKDFYHFEPTTWSKFKIFFFETRFFRYMGRVMTLNFGTLRNDSNKTVLSEVVRRFKYSLTLSLIPLLITFFLCQIFGALMAYQHHRWPDYSFNLFFLILYAIPIFVVAPFLIEKVALNHTFPFTNIPIPLSGFTSPETIYSQKTSLERLFDVLQHIFLPLVAIMYGSLAAEARLSRTAVLEVLRLDYVRTARAKGVPPATIFVKHVGRNAAITIVTSIASSLGIVLGGSLIVETLFDINGFGKFFYDAIVNRDYNVIMFSALAGSFLSLLGYLIADIAYTLLDPRVTLE